MIYLVYLAADAGQELSGLGSGGARPELGLILPPACLL